MRIKINSVDCAIVMNPYAVPEQIKAGVDAAINLHIFDRAWAMYLTGTSVSANTQPRYDILAQHCRLLIEYCGEISLYWVALDDGSRLTKPAELSELLSINPHTFRQHLRSLRCVFNF